MLTTLCRVGLHFAWIVMATLMAASVGQFSKASALQQESGDRARGLWDKTFETERARPRKNRKRPPADQDTGATALIGVTIWRLASTEAESSSAKPRSLEHNVESGLANFPAERVETSTLFREHDRIRIGIEVPHDGFLYVVDCDVYSDGRLGDPFLIFPTRELRRGDNRVYPGRLIEIPSQSDDPPYFTFKRNRKDQVSDKLTIIVSPFPLAIATPKQTTRLDRAQVTKWENFWGGASEHREASANTQRRRTRAEQEAVEGRRLLQRGDPLPQTIFRASVKPGSPLLITLPLRIAP